MIEASGPSYKFFVPGVPAPGGSKRHIGGGRMIDACKRNAPWRAMVALAAMEAGCKPMDGPLLLSIGFNMPRPKGHYRKDGTLKPNAPHFPTVKPDTTKLVRALEDALKGIAWTDDAQVVTQIARKNYALHGPAGAWVQIDREHW